MTESTIRVLIVDDHQVVRIGMRQLLASSAGFRVVGEAGTAEEAVQRISVVQRTLLLSQLLLDLAGDSAPGRRSTKSRQGVRPPA